MMQPGLIQAGMNRHARTAFSKGRCVCAGRHLRPVPDHGCLLAPVFCSASCMP